MAKRLNTLQQLLISAKALTDNIKGLNTAATRAQARGQGFNLTANNPFDIKNLTSIQFWSSVIKKQDQVRLQALAVNTNPQALAAAAGTGVSRAGFTNAVVNQLELLTTGLDEQLNSTKELGLQMRVTGQNENKLYQTLRQSQVLGGLTNRGIENLSDHMMRLGKTYNISTEAMVDSIQKISSDMNVNALEFTDSFTSINSEITARFGAQAATILTEMESQYAAGNTFVTDQIVGAFNGLGDTVESVKQYTSLYANRFGEFLKQFPPQMKAVGLQIAKGVFGEQGLAAYNFQRMLDQGEKQTSPEQDKFATLQTAMATLYTPLDRIATWILPTLIGAILPLTAAVVSLQTAFLLKGLGGGAGTMAPTVLGGLARFIPALGVMALAGTGVYLYLKHLAKIDEDRLAIEKTKEQREYAKERAANEINTAKYMELQVQTIDDSINRIMFNGDLSRRLAAETDKRKIDLSEKLIAVISKMDPSFRSQSRPSMP